MTRTGFFVARVPDLRVLDSWSALDLPHFEVTPSTHIGENANDIRSGGSIEINER